jgi:hypothetical protein
MLVLLGKSCMADDMCQPYLTYILKSKSVSLIILEVLKPW